MTDLTLHFDGACEPNPRGVATWGWVAFGPGGAALWSDGGVAARGEGATNNVAEYHALGRGLRFLADALADGRALALLGIRPARLVVRGDSQLVVRQVAGEWACNAPGLVPLRDRCRELVAAVESSGPAVEIGWVPREQNEAADAISRSAWESATGRKFPERPARARR